MRIIDVNTKSSTSSFSIWACVVVCFFLRICDMYCLIQTMVVVHKQRVLTILHTVSENRVNCDVTVLHCQTIKDH